MSLNIKNPETHRLARELAHMTGESVTQAVTEAIRERLERYGNGTKESRREWLERISAITAPLMKDGRTSTEMLDELYDPETGLPK